MERRERRSHTSPAGTLQRVRIFFDGGGTAEDSDCSDCRQSWAALPLPTQEEEEQSLPQSCPSKTTLSQAISPMAVSELAAQLRADVAEKLGIMSEELQAAINSRVDTMVSSIRHVGKPGIATECQEPSTSGCAPEGLHKSLTLPVTPKLRRLGSSNSLRSHNSRSALGRVLGRKSFSSSNGSVETGASADTVSKLGRKKRSRSVSSHSSPARNSEQHKCSDEVCSNRSDETFYTTKSNYTSKSNGLFHSEKHQAPCITDIRVLQDLQNSALLADAVREEESAVSSSNTGMISGFACNGDVTPAKYSADALTSIINRCSSHSQGSWTAAQTLRNSLQSNASGRPIVGFMSSHLSMRSVIANPSRHASLQAMVNIHSKGLASDIINNSENDRHLAWAVVKISIVLAIWVAGVVLTTIEVVSVWPTQDSKLILIYDTTFAFGSSLSLAVFLYTGRLREFSHSGMLAILVSTDKNLALKWRQGRTRWIVQTLICMPIFAMSRAAVYLAYDDSKISASGLTALGIIAGAYMGQAYYIIHGIKAMEVMIDSFCFKLITDPSCRRSICEWNTLQAMLRSVSNAIAPCFVSLFTTVLVLLLIVVNQILIVEFDSTEDFLAVAGPTLLLMLTFLRLLCKACEVSGKCARVPPFVNSLHFSDRVDHIDNERQYLVMYISYSAAGFYIFDIHLESSVTFKAFYFFGAIVFFVISTFLASNAQ